MMPSTTPSDRRGLGLAASFLSALLVLGAAPEAPASDPASSGSGEREEIEVESKHEEESGPQDSAEKDRGPSLLPGSHHGSWKGSNRLWVMDPDKPFRSAGTVQGTGDEVRYTWTHEDRSQTGVIRLSGQPAALRADWTDTWHAKDGMTLHGFRREGVVQLFGTYPDGQGGSWGWQIEIDARDPESFVLRMFNVIPDLGPVPAVVLSATREGR